MKLPEVRDELFALANELPGPQAERLRRLAEETRRRPAACRAKRTAPALTEEKRAEILEARRHFPDVGLKELGDFVGVNMGRVSEVLHGMRT